MRYILAILVMTIGTQVSAEERLTGSEAIELVEFANNEGVVLGQRQLDTGAYVIQVLAEGRYYFCFIEPRNQWCEDNTGYADNLEAK